MVSVVVIKFSGMRCQPLRRALAQNFATKAEQSGDYEIWLSVNIKVKFLNVK